MIRIALIDDYQDAGRRFADWSRLAGTELTVFHDTLHDEDALVERLQPFEVVCIIRERSRFPRSVLARLPKLKLIASNGMKNAAIDLAAAAALGIAVTGTRSAAHPTVELTWGLILGLARGIAREDQAMRQGGWQSTVGMDLHGRTLGILGVGRLGTRVAQVGQALGMQVIGWSRSMTPEKAEGLGIRAVDPDQLMAEADVASIHLVLSEATRGLVGAERLARMKPTALLINTSRGPIVDEAALVRTLQERRIRGAGLDVYDREPLAVDHPLRRLDNVLLTPHLGYVTEENYRNFFSDMVECIQAWMAEQPIRLITPAAPRA